MTNYAKVENDIVTNVIVAEASFFDTFVDDSPGNWIEIENGGIGYTYDTSADVFVSPAPYDSWSLDSNHDWQPPTPMPTDDKIYIWSEDNLSWTEITNSPMGV